MPARTLTVMRAAIGAAAHQSTRVVLYARVSSKDQEKEGYSIPAQQRSLREYALEREMIVAEEFVDVETAKQSGRTAFTAMLEYLKKHHATCRTILVEKPDRLYRKLKDWTTLDDFGGTVHLVKEGRVIGPDSRSSDHLVHGINVLMARNYILNLGEETRKGMLEKARSGIYPSFAPIGYRNAEGPNGKRIIVPDACNAGVVSELFSRFATGKYSLDAIIGELRAEGVTLRGRRLQKSTLHQILRKRLYMGEFDFDGVTYGTKFYSSAQRQSMNERNAWTTPPLPHSRAGPAVASPWRARPRGRVAQNSSLVPGTVVWVIRNVSFSTRIDAPPAENLAAPP